MISRETYKGLYDVDSKIINGVPTILLFIRNEDGTKEVKRVTNFKPYCYVNNTLLKSKNFILPTYANISGFGPDDIYGGPVHKITFNHPKEQLFFKKYITELQGNLDNTYELDLSIDMRFMIDCVEKVESTNYKTITFDIETTCDNGFPDNDNPIEKITCITAHDSFNDEYSTFVWRENLTDYHSKVHDNKIIRYYNNEEEMLSEFLKYLNKANGDILTAWNISFDIGYLYTRLKYLNLDTNKLTSFNDDIDNVIWKGINFNAKVTKMLKGEIKILGLVLADSLKMYRQLHFGELESYSLNSVADAELGDQKLPVHDMSKTWRENLEELIYYNIKDVELVVRINEKCKLLDLFEQIRCFAGVRNITDCFYMSRIHDIKILKKYNNQKVFPSKPIFRERGEDERLQGAYVFTNPGLYDNVVFFDYSGLYPNIIKTFNLSIEKIEDNGMIVNNETGLKVNQDGQGIMPSVIDDLLQLKKELKEQMQGTGGQDLRDKMFAIKIVINSIWGVFASNGFRINDLRLANAVTYNARQLICKARDVVVEDTGYTHVMSDTDSIGFVIPKDKDPIVEGKRLQKLINEQIEKFIVEELGMPKNYIFMEFEKFAAKAFIQTKKRYVLRTTWDDGDECDKIKACGMQVRRSDTAPMSKVFQKELFRLLLTQDNFNLLNEYVKKTIDNMINRKIDLNHIAIPSKLNKAIEKYTITRVDKEGHKTTKQANRPVIRGVKWSNQNLGLRLREGNKFKLLYITGQTSDVMCFEDETQFKSKNIKIDWLAMTTKNIYQKAKPIYDVLGKMDELDTIMAVTKLKLSGQQTLI